MKGFLRCSLLLVMFLFPVSVCASWGESNDWLDIPAEYREELMEKLEDSRKFTKDHLKIVKECLNESSVKESINCISAGGVDDVTEVLEIIREELGSIRERICGSSFAGNKDKCDRFGDRIIRLKDDFQDSWDAALEKGKQALEEANRLLFMKRKICNKIQQKGCYQWLNERIELQCDPRKIGPDPALVERCQLDVVDDVWSRLNAAEMSN